MTNHVLQDAVCRNCLGRRVAVPGHPLATTVALSPFPLATTVALSPLASHPMVVILNSSSFACLSAVLQKKHASICLSISCSSSLCWCRLGFVGTSIISGVGH